MVGVLHIACDINPLLQILFFPFHGLPFLTYRVLLHTKVFIFEEVQFVHFVVITYGNANSSVMKLLPFKFSLKEKFYL